MNYIRYAIYLAKWWYDLVDIVWQQIRLTMVYILLPKSFRNIFLKMVSEEAERLRILNEHLRQRVN